MRYSVVFVLALVCVSSALTVERLQKNAAVIRGQLASKAGAKTTRLTICRTDGRSPEVLAESGGFCPRQTVPPQVIEEFYNTKRNNPQEWNEFFKAHEAGNFKYIVSYSSNCAFTSVADYEYFYQVDIDVEDISNDPVIKGLTNNIQTSTTTIFRGVDQNGGGHFEWDSFGCIPVKYITNYRKAKINPKYKKDSTVPEERLMYLTEKQGNGGSGTVLVYDPPVTINWNTYADKLSTKAPTPPPIGLTTQEVTSQLNEMLTKRKAYEPLAHGTAKGCTSASECANSQTPRCCFFPPTSWGSICSEAAGTRAGGQTCLDRPVAGDTVALCTKDQDCSANKSATKCCYRPSSGTVAGVGVCTVPETNAFKKADFLKKCKDVPNGYTLPPVSTARLSGF